MTTKKVESKMIVHQSWEDFCATMPELAAKPPVVLADELDGVWDKERSPFIAGEVSHPYSWETEREGVKATAYGVALKLRVPTHVIDVEEPAPAGRTVGVNLCFKLGRLAYMRPGDLVLIEYRGEVRGKSGRRVHRFRMASPACAQSTPMSGIPPMSDSGDDAPV